MKVLILAAGYGTRLYPLIKDTPKSLLPIADRPLINYLLDRIEALSDLREVIVVTNNKFYNNFSQWAENIRNPEAPEAQEDFPVPVKILNDQTNSPDDRLGSVGDINYVLENYPVEDDLLIIGGDNLFDFNLEEYNLFARQQNSAATIGIYDIEDIEEAKKFGVVAIDAKSKVTSFEEKPESPKSSLIAMCFYYFPKKSLGSVAGYLRQTGKTDKAGDYIKWLSQESTVYGFKFQGKWYDIGSIEAYNEAQDEFKN